MKTQNFITKYICKNNAKDGMDRELLKFLMNNQGSVREY